MVKQGSRFGVKLKAKAPSIHMIQANIETEVSPIVGSEKQSEDLVNYLLSEFENDPKKFGNQTYLERVYMSLLMKAYKTNYLKCLKKPNANCKKLLSVL